MQMILKNQESITHNYETNAPATKKRLCGPQFEDVDSTLGIAWLDRCLCLSLGLCCKRKH